jgi:hypothetical protein
VNVDTGLRERYMGNQKWSPAKFIRAYSDERSAEERPQICTAMYVRGYRFKYISRRPAPMEPP